MSNIFVSIHISSLGYSSLGGNTYTFKMQFTHLRLIISQLDQTLVLSGKEQGGGLLSLPFKGPICCS